MKIELKQLKISGALSQDSTAYTAIIHVDGKPAFYASNHGFGGADLFNLVRDYDGPGLEEVQRWLALNEPPSGPFEPDPTKRAPYDCGSACDLEMLVARLTDLHEAQRRLRQLLKTRILRIGDDQQLYELAMKPTQSNLSAVKEQHANWLIVNDASPEVIERATRILSGGEDGREDVYTRQREGRLTLADARWLQAGNRRAEQPCRDLEQFLEELIGREQARLDEYRTQRQAHRDGAESPRGTA